MSPEKEQDASNHTSEIGKFYREKTLFLTGAAGFLGMVLLETLLRCCPDIRRVYILLRPKKGVQPEDRKEALFEKEIFQVLKVKDPSALKKVVVVTGDVAFENLGISEEDMKKITREVSVVFHCAAAISFMKPLSFMLQQNLLGTNNVVEVCKKIQNFEVLVYTSTFFSNCNHKKIEERIYDLPFPVEEAMELARHGNEEELLKLYRMLEPNLPNYYTFSKCLSENLLRSRFTDVPSCIIRPSIILCCYKGSSPGFIENGTGIVSLSVGIGKGFIRVIRLDPDVKCEVIPADIVANTHVIAAVQQATQRLPSLTVYNCTGDENVSVTWYDFINTLLKNTIKYPLPRSFQTPGLTIAKSAIKYRILSFIDHYLPAAVIDTLMWITGRKLRLLKLYKFFDKNMEALSFFALHEWDKEIDNFLSLSGKLNSTDKELLPVELDFNVEGLSNRIIAGAPQYKKKDNKSYEERLRITYLRYFFTSMIKWSVLGGLASIFYVMVF